MQSTPVRGRGSTASSRSKARKEEEEEGEEEESAASDSSSTSSPTSALFSGLTFCIPRSDATLARTVTNAGGRLVPAPSSKDNNSNKFDVKTTLVLVTNLRPLKKRGAQTAKAAPSRVDDDEFVDDAWHVYANWIADCVDEQELLPLDGKPQAEHNFNDAANYMAMPPPDRVPNPVFACKLPTTFTANDRLLLRAQSQAMVSKGEDAREVAVWRQFQLRNPHNALSRFTGEQLRDAFRKEDRIPDEEDDEDEDKEEEEEEEEPKKKKKKTATAKTTTKPPAAKKQKRAADVDELDSTANEEEEEEQDAAPRRDVRYSEEEETALKELLGEYSTIVSAPKLAQKAMQAKTCPGRNERSLTQRIRVLLAKPVSASASASATGPRQRAKFTAEDDSLMLAWWREWKATYDGRGVWGKSVWEEAVKQNVFEGNFTATQLHDRFHNRLSRVWKADGEFAAPPVPEAERKFTLPQEPKKAPPKSSTTPSSYSGSKPKAAAATTTATAAPKADEKEQEDDSGVALAQDVVKRLIQAAGGSVSVDDAVDALQRTSGDGQAALRLLLDSAAANAADGPYETWTKDEDAALRANKPTGRPDELKRKRFLGL